MPILPKLRERGTNAFLVFLAVAWSAILIVHISLKCGGEDSLETFKSLIIPALLLTILSAAWLCVKHVQNRDLGALESMEALVYERGIALAVDNNRACYFSYSKKAIALLVAIAGTAIACIVCTALLDRATETERTNRAVAESVCMAILFVLCALYVAVVVGNMRELVGPEKESEKLDVEALNERSPPSKQSGR